VRKPSNLDFFDSESAGNVSADAVSSADEQPSLHLTCFSSESISDEIEDSVEPDHLSVFSDESVSIPRWRVSSVAIPRWLAPTALVFGVGILAAIGNTRALQPVTATPAAQAMAARTMLLRRTPAQTAAAQAAPVGVSPPASPGPLVARAVTPPPAASLPTVRPAEVPLPRVDPISKPTLALVTQTSERSQKRVNGNPTQVLPQSPQSEPAELVAAVPATSPVELPATIVGKTMPPSELAPLPNMTTAPAAVVTPERDLVLRVLRQYETALQALDVVATAAVWPSVDRRALSRAFGSLKSQDLAFDNCDIKTTGLTAVASCHGTAQYVTKVGRSAPRTEQQQWLFRMRKFGAEWKIDGVSATQVAAGSSAALREQS
jgi:hypothetical protein